MKVEPIIPIFRFSQELPKVVGLPTPLYQEEPVGFKEVLLDELKKIDLTA